MRDVPVRFNLNLRTGFFKTEPCVVTMSRKALVFTRAGEDRSEEKFLVDCADVKSVVIFGKTPAELEIRTAKKVFTGTFQSSAEVVEAVAALRAVFGKRFLKESFA